VRLIFKPSAASELDVIKKYMDKKIKRLRHHIDKIDELILKVFQLPLQDEQKEFLRKISKHLDDIEKTFGLYDESSNEEVWNEFTEALLKNIKS
jgi:hypothetical protein